MNREHMKFSRDPLRGMKDFYPPKLREVNWIIENIRDIVELYCYVEYEVPLMEPIEIYAAKSSEELVNEQSFYVEKKKGEKLILRPEITPSLARMVARKSQELKKPIRWYSNPTCYRYERPQKGRRREFKQFNVDILGEDSLFAELEIFNIIIDILKGFGATSEQFQIFYNSRRFVDAVCEFILDVPHEKLPLVYKVLDKSDKMDENEFEKYVIDSFESEVIVQGILKLKDSDNLNELLESFNDVPKEFHETKGYRELNEIERLIEKTNISEYCSFSSGVVRGLDYYTGVVFEVFDIGGENNRAIFGGGRYDDLLSLFSEEQLSGIGFGMGVLMLSLFLKTYNLIPASIRQDDYSDTIYIASINEKVAIYSSKLGNLIRDEGLPCIVDYRFKGLKNQLSKANELGVKIALIVGPKELEEEKVTVKNMESEEQKTISNDKLVPYIYNILEEIEENH
ncbi:MAG: histidine--tRNA ligase [Candidatus Lokiarchaeota archaeon]|nr:histidine--tRNA ligase [Candidatus Lokiarchaeota archaeon]MBD3341901.1 histidine--tRNA ligase [Candidatus Lokiarchaeota archaeon]